MILHVVNNVFMYINFKIILLHYYVMFLYVLHFKLISNTVNIYQIFEISLIVQMNNKFMFIYQNILIINLSMYLLYDVIIIDMLIVFIFSMKVVVVFDYFIFLSQQFNSIKLNFQKLYLFLMFYKMNFIIM